MEHRQLTLPLSWKFAKDASSFIVSDCNRYVFDWLEKWPFKIKDNFVCLVGESGSGKTHLANVWASRLNAEIITSTSDIFIKWFEISSPDSQQRYFVLDDADRINDDILLYYIYNTIKEKNAYILMVAKNPPLKWQIKLPDIRSRISTINVINIKRPNENEMRCIFEKMLEQRGIKDCIEIIDYIINRIDRSYSSMNFWAQQIDQAICSNKRQSLQNIKDKLEETLYLP
jgi:chromosomal replication initiation ATPase DnaA